MASLLGFCQMTKTMQIFVPSFSFMAEQQIVIILIKTHFSKTNFLKSAKCFPSFQMLPQCKLKFHFISESTNNTASKKIYIKKYLKNKRPNRQEKNIKMSLQKKIIAVMNQTKLHCSKILKTPNLQHRYFLISYDPCLKTLGNE